MLYTRFRVNMCLPQQGRCKVAPKRRHGRRQPRGNSERETKQRRTPQ
nr:MAG TPA: hypothetical protein [Caudoviricetes sp.]DAF26429.1 MAG TPA: hypothetical protein [Caudoviricetes sp.]DAZ60416.1 MAG TPA: hypothetical protein [Caudoviricetes sp.]